MSLDNKSVAGKLLQTVKNYIDGHFTVLSTSLNNKNKTKRFKVPKGTTSVSTGTPFITNDSLISFDRIIGNPATSIANIGVDGDYFVDGGKIHFKEFNKDIVISCGVNYGTHDISQADILGQKTTEADISKMKHEVDMLSGSGIGYDGIYYIQDAGSKMQGKIYLDKTQEGIWKCRNNTTSINNTTDFERIDATSIDNKLRNLIEYKKLRTYTTGTRISIPIQKDIMIYFIFIAQSSGGVPAKRLDRVVTIPGIGLDSNGGKYHVTETGYGSDSSFMTRFSIRNDANEIIVESLNTDHIGCEIIGYKLNYFI